MDNRLITPEALVELVSQHIITTPRLNIRRSNETDRNTLRTHENDDRIMARIRGKLPAAEIEKRLDRFLAAWSADEGEWVSFSIVPKQADGLIGVWAFRILSRDSGQIELGWRLHPDHHGQGYAKEASEAMVRFLFERVGAVKLVAFCTADNQASFRLMEHLGMVREGLFRRHSKIDGVWYDELAYGLLPEDLRL